MWIVVKHIFFDREYNQLMSKPGIVKENSPELRTKKRRKPLHFSSNCFNVKRRVLLLHQIDYQVYVISC